GDRAHLVKRDGERRFGCQGVFYGEHCYTAVTHSLPERCIPARQTAVAEAATMAIEQQSWSRPAIRPVERARHTAAARGKMEQALIQQWCAGRGNEFRHAFKIFPHALKTPGDRRG